MTTKALSRSVDAFVEKVPGVCGGSAVIAGTRISVYEVVELTRAGLSPDALLERFGGDLTKDHILAALAYAWRHEEEIQRLLVESAQIHRDLAMAS